MTGRVNVCSVTSGFAGQHMQYCADCNPPCCPLLLPTPLQLLAPKYFLKWKQRHQLKYRFTLTGLEVSQFRSTGLLGQAGTGMRWWVGWRAG